jgi:hypothetical protein
MRGMDIIVPQVIPQLLNKESRNPAVNSILHRIVNSLYFNSIQDEFDYAVLSDIPALQSKVRPRSTASISFTAARSLLQELRLTNRIEKCSFDGLENFRLSSDWQSAMRKLLLLFHESI